MRIINILEIINGIPSQIESFPVYEEHLSKDAIQDAEEFFIKLIEEHKHLTEEDEEYYIDQTFFDDKNGHEVYILWSN